MSHTAGPWSWESPNVYDAEGELLAYLLSGAEHNGHLIAAAPDLLELVKAGLAYEGNDYYLDEYWVKRAEAAIARIEGLTP